MKLILIAILVLLIVVAITWPAVAGVNIIHGMPPAIVPTAIPQI